MALQGTIDTFALADVLRLLASTSKTGRLRLDGDRGRGDVEVIDGQVHRISVDPSGPAGSVPVDESLFELLRFADGAFEFEAGSPHDDQGERHDLEPLLARAEELLGEWERIASVIPSPACRLDLAPELPGEEVAIDAERWRVVATIGAGTTPAQVGAHLGASELVAGRLICGLVELGVVRVGDEVELTSGEPHAAPDAVAPDTVASMPPAWDVETPAPEPDRAPSFDDAEPGPASSGGAEPPASWFEDTGWDTPPGSVPAPEVDPFSPADETNRGDDDAAEFARHLANLSPKAAKAVAAAAQATSTEERDRVLAEVEATEELDHALLLRFLGDPER